MKEFRIRKGTFFEPTNSGHFSITRDMNNFQGLGSDAIEEGRKWTHISMRIFLSHLFAYYVNRGVGCN